MLIFFWLWFGFSQKEKKNTVALLSEKIAVDLHSIYIKLLLCHSKDFIFLNLFLISRNQWYTQKHHPPLHHFEDVKKNTSIFIYIILNLQFWIKAGFSGFKVYEQEFQLKEATLILFTFHNIFLVR